MSNVRYYLIIGLILLIMILPTIMVFLDTSIRTDCLVARIVLIGWVAFIILLVLPDKKHKTNK